MPVPISRRGEKFVRRIGFAVALFGIAIGPSAHAGPFYLGTWKFVSAVVAPWADPHEKPDASEKDALVDKTVTLAATAIAGPKVFACKGPHYKVSDFTADLLFQGAFEEMRDNDKSVDPQKLAASLGFTGTSFKTLETGCEIDWHFVDMDTVEVALDDYVYTLKRQ
jgi:hypothetical protein